MLDAIQEIAEHRPDEEKEHMAVLQYLQACNLLFENGTLSHKSIDDDISSEILKNIKEAFQFFQNWKNSFPASMMYYSEAN